MTSTHKAKGMESLVVQAFHNAEGLGPHVLDGHYDIIGPEGQIVLPQTWELLVKPGWEVEMQMWALPDLNMGYKGVLPRRIPMPPPGNLPSIDELLRGLGTGKKIKGKKKGKALLEPIPPPPESIPPPPLPCPACGFLPPSPVACHVCDPFKAMMGDPLQGMGPPGKRSLSRSSSISIISANEAPPHDMLEKTSGYESSSGSVA